MLEFSSIFGLENCTSKASIPEVPTRYTCIIINDDIPNGGGFLNVVGKIVNDNGGTNKIEDFLLTVNGSHPQPYQFFTNERPGMSITMHPGKFGVTQNPLFGYSVQFEGDCFGEMKTWDTKLCKVINDDIPGGGGLLKVILVPIDDKKNIINDRIIINDSSLLNSGFGSLNALNNTLSNSNDTHDISGTSTNIVCPTTISCPYLKNRIQIV